MNIAVLGYGKEGQSAEQYFTRKGHEVAVYDNFRPEDLTKINFSDYDLILRSPSVHPQAGFSSMTQYFFTHCPCPIIGVTGTKGKGTTCSLITQLLKNIFQSIGDSSRQVYLVGNIGNPALDILDQVNPNDAVIYEMSSFQLWDLTQSPHVAVILPIEPDHLNIHDTYEDYVSAKGNICKYQSAKDYCIYYQANPDTAKIAQQGHGHKISYPLRDRSQLDDILNHLTILGQHNRDNAEAALLAVSSYLSIELNDLISRYSHEIIAAFQTFTGLPHRLQFLRELNGVKYYDDNFSTTPTSLKVALNAFPDSRIVLITGGRDKTDYQDLPEIINLIKNHPNISRIILIGESGKELYKSLHTSIPDQISLADTLDTAVQVAAAASEGLTIYPNSKAFLPTTETSSEPADSNSSEVIVLMSPAAASFDMFKNVYDRGDQFQKLVRELK